MELLGRHSFPVGMISDRDIAIRGIGMGRAPDRRIGDVMTTDDKYCYEHQDLDEACVRRRHPRFAAFPAARTGLIRDGLAQASMLAMYKHIQRFGERGSRRLPARSQANGGQADASTGGTDGCRLNC